MAELGQTDDPRELIKGRPEAIEENARVLQARAERAQHAGNGLRKIDTGSWQGQAATAFHDKFSYEPNKWLDAADALGNSAKLVTQYAEVLRWAQSQAADAIRMWKQAEAASQQAHAQQVQAEAQAGAQHQPPPAFTDPGDAGRQAARETLERARAQLHEAGDSLAGFLRDDADGAPQQSSWIDGAGDFLADAGGQVLNSLASLGNAALNHPGDVATAAAGAALTAVSSAGEVGGGLLDATGVGAVAGVPLNAVSAAGIATGVTMTAASVGDLGRHAATDDTVEPVQKPTKPPKRRVVDNVKDPLDAKHLDAAKRERDGEVVARSPKTGEPYDHVTEVSNAQRALSNRIKKLQRLLGDTRTAAEDRPALEQELSDSSKLLDHSESIVGRL